MFGSQDHGNSDKTALGKDYIRLVCRFKSRTGFGVSFDDAERIGKILDIKVAAQFARGYAIIRNSGVLNELVFDAVVGPDIVDLVAMLPVKMEAKPGLV